MTMPRTDKDAPQLVQPEAAQGQEQAPAPFFEEENRHEGGKQAEPDAGKENLNHSGSTSHREHREHGEISAHSMLSR